MHRHMPMQLLRSYQYVTDGKGERIIAERNRSFDLIACWEGESIQRTGNGAGRI